MMTFHSQLNGKVKLLFQLPPTRYDISPLMILQIISKESGDAQAVLEVSEFWGLSAADGRVTGRFTGDNVRS